MRRLSALIIAILLVHAAAAAPIVNFKISKTVCLLTFLEAATGEAHSSVTLRKYIASRLQDADSADFNKLTRKYTSLNLSQSYVLSEYPPQRQKPRSSANLIKIAAVQAVDTKDFLSRIAGILPNEQWLMLKEVLEGAEYYYDELIYKEHKPALEKQLTELKLYNDKTKKAFYKLKTFYGSSWPDNLPFTVAIYPIPGNSGNTSATPHNNSLVMAVLTHEKDHDARIGVAVHEICHVLYEEQPLDFQWKLDSAFQVSQSVSKQYAYSYIDEALATACGNGWMYEYITGRADKGAWYNDEYIDGYAHALYPLVKAYIDNDKRIDRRFITNAIELFEKQFPDAAYEYNNLFNNMSVYTDASNNEQYRTIMNTVNRHYRVTSSHSSYPITDPHSLSMADNSSGTQLFIVHTNKQENLAALRKIFPELGNVNEEEESVISFMDKMNRPVVVVNVNDASRIEAAFKKMVETKKISRSLSSVIIE